jgi:type IV secretory pathway VirB2 component (pilin)
MAWNMNFRKVMRQILQMLILVLAVCGTPDSLLAQTPTANPGNTTGQNNQIFQAATTQANDIFSASLFILNGLAMLGVLGVGAMAMTGRMPWGWAFALMGGLLLARMADPLRTWVLAIADTASPQSQNGDIKTVTQTVNLGAQELAGDLRDNVLVFSGLMIACLAILSVFGRFQWKWLACVVGGLFIVNYGEQIAIEFTTTQVGPATGLNQVGNALSGGEQLVDRTARQGQYIIYGIGAVAILGLAAMASVGRFSWGWFFAACGGLILVAGVSQGIQYISGQEGAFTQQLPPPGN